MLTSFAGQGATVDRVLIAPSAVSSPASNQRQLYVDASRGREAVTRYTDDQRALRDAIPQADTRLHALDLVAGIARPKPASRQQRMKRLEHLRRLARFAPGSERHQEQRHAEPVRERGKGVSR